MHEQAQGKTSGEGEAIWTEKGVRCEEEGKGWEDVVRGMGGMGGMCKRVEAREYHATFFGS